MPSWFVYMIRCKNDCLYTGVTTDVARRFEEHASGGPRSAKYLRGKGPLTLAYKRRVGTQRLALQVEHAIKQLPKSSKEEIVQGRGAIRKILRDLRAAEKG